MDNGYNNYMYGQYIPPQPPQAKKSFVNASMILGLLGAVIILVGLMLPAIDLSHFHSEVELQYNLFKLGKNVGLISAMWNVIPYAIVGGIILLVILSFVRIPVLKILPVVLILCMFILMLADMGNLVSWANETLDKLGINLETKVSTGEIFKALMPGIYIMVVGVIVTLISCFTRIKEY